MITWRTAGVLAIALASALGGGSATTGELPVARTHGPNLKNGTGTSSNWSGYAVKSPNGSVTDVKGTWTVTSVTSHPGPNQYSSFWVGIDGYTSNTVEQIGTDSDFINGAPVYYAWYEFYPKPSRTITSVSVNPNDVIFAEVSESRGTFVVSIRNQTTGQSFSTSERVNKAKQTSAEWIAEAPSGGGVLPLADFGTVFFSACSAAANGLSAPIGGFGTNFDSINMVSSGTLKADTSGLSPDGTSFSVHWDHQ